MRCSGHPTRLYFEQKDIPHKWGHGHLGVGAKEPILGLINCHRGPTFSSRHIERRRKKPPVFRRKSVFTRRRVRIHWAGGTKLPFRCNSLRRSPPAGPKGRKAPSGPFSPLGQPARFARRLDNLHLVQPLLLHRDRGGLRLPLHPHRLLLGRHHHDHGVCHYQLHHCYHKQIEGKAKQFYWQWFTT